MDGIRRDLVDAESTAKDAIKEALVPLSDRTTIPTDAAKKREFFSDKLAELGPENVAYLEEVRDELQIQLIEYTTRLRDLSDADRDAENDAHPEVAASVERTNKELKSVISKAKLFATKMENGFRRAQEAVVNAQEAANTANQTMMNTSAANLSTTIVDFMDKSPVPMFDGDALKWTNWITLYDETVHNQMISDLAKFNKLLKVLEKDALTAVKQFVVSGDNYDKAYKLLKNRYGDKTKIEMELYRKLRSIASPNQSINDQRRYADEIGSIYSQMKAIRANTDNIMVAQEVLRRLPDRTRDKIADSIAFDEIHNIQVLLDNLNRVLNRMDVSNFTREMASGMISVGNQRPTNYGLPTQRTQNSGNCVYCKQDGHNCWNCPSTPSPDSREAVLRQERRCFNCLEAGHMVSACRKSGCRHCGTKHHSSLACRGAASTARPLSRSTGLPANGANHQPQKPSNISPASGANQQRSARALCTSVHPLETKPDTLPNGRIFTATVKIYNNDWKHFEDVGVVLDTGAEISLVTESAVRKYGLTKVTDFHATIKGLDNTEIARKKIGFFNVHLLDTRGNRFTIQASCSGKTIVEEAPPAELTSKDKKKLKQEGITLKELQCGTKARPEILIGSDLLPSMFIEGKVVTLSKNRVVLPTRFGPVLYGGEAISKDKLNVNCLTAGIDVERLWTMESGINEFHGPSFEEKKYVNSKVVEQFERDIRPSEEGYVIKLPWKSDGTKDALPSNFGIAINRLLSIVKRYKDNNWVMSKYQETIEDQRKKGIIEEVDPNDPPVGGIVHYLSHHPVITPQKETTKLRIVYDGSAHKVGKPSLNDSLHQGPTILPSLIGQLLRFRFGKNAIIADVEKAFLQVVIDQSDRDATRFLWLKDISKPATMDNITVWRFRRVLFGVNASPFILAQTIIHHLNHLVDDVNLKNEIKLNLYVDNLTVTAETTEEGIEKYRKTKSIFNDMKMNLRDYCSNDRDLLALIPEGDKAKSTQQKVLGIAWDTEHDHLSIKNDFQDEGKVTKRSILKQHAKNFDPLGFLTPLSVKSKRFIQGLWKKDYSWDKAVSEEDRNAWIQLTESIGGFKREIPRNCRGPSGSAKLVIFSDASIVAQAACAYLLTEDSCHLIFARSKVHDVIKQQTIPKLEMNAALIGARMSLTIGNELNTKCDIERVILFSDSEITLSWIRSTESPSSAGTMVTNRWREMRKIEEEWRKRNVTLEAGYIRSHLNPADCASRGVDKSVMEEDLWWNGPPFLLLDEKEWPGESRVQALPGEKSVIVGLTKIKEDEPLAGAKHRPLISQVRINAICMRFVWHLTSKVNEKRAFQHKLQWIRKVGEKTKRGADLQLSAEELQESMKMIIRHHQGTFGVGEDKSRRKQLQMKLDENGIWRCARRLEESDLNPEASRPVFIHPRSKLARSIAMDCHETRQRFKKHLAVEHRISEVRKTYWIPGLRSLIQSVARKCWICRRFTALPFRYPAAHALPSRRVRRSMPFQHIGIDYFGPIDYKTDSGTRGKGYGFILTCATTRLVHLELVTNLTTSSFIMAFQRFIGRRGVPETVTSDNATTFKAAEKILLDMAQNRKDDAEIVTFMANNSITWHYITPHSPGKEHFTSA
ncbi:hypothetical protein L596_019605 [Steinernema carpocapsae]|uniref:Integrase catalytic domain-containing protein n=1 Tax=Steinernema carpocapsae TaxID=34508 RepID=A0A4U5MRI3_STECR|nr:hypothetical protein L596_019605 [Steinernema carpocapsae]